MCRDYLRIKRVLVSQMTPEELLSEVWQKLLGTVSLHNGEAPNSADWSIDPHAPARDARVVWLIEEIGGTEAMAHRFEDILRQRFGRSLPGRGRRLVQPENEDEPFEIGSDSVECGTLQEEDARRAWRGLLATANLEFQRDDDVSMLLRLMADVPGLFEESGGQWPVKKMIELLNDRFSPPPWSGSRVDNAKRRLLHWINSLMRKHGLDATDLEGLFARVARRQEGGERASVTEPRHPNLPG